MKHILLGLALVASPAVAQVPLYPMPTPPLVVQQYMEPFVFEPVVPYYLTPVPQVYTPQYIYRTVPNSTMALPTPDYALVPRANGTYVYPTIPNSTLYDITQPQFIIK